MLLRTTISAALLLTGAAALAQHHPDTLRLHEVTVTAVKQNTATTDVSATVLGRAMVERNDVVAIKGATAMVPNVFVPDYGSRMTSTIYVRGIGTRIDQPAVGLNVDNVPVMCKENYDIDLMDVSRVEMLRGPQSTLYGRNTMGGVMNVYTLSPLNYQGTRGVVTAASHGMWKLGAAHYALVGDKLGLSATAYFTRTAGEFVNTHNGRRADWERQGSARLKAHWLPADRWQVSNVLTVSHSRQGGYPYEYTATGRIAYNDTCFYRRTSVTDGLTVRYQSRRFSLTSITSYQFIDDNMTLDQDFTPQPYFTLTQARREHAVTQDVVLRDRDDALAAGYHWLAGAFGFYRHMTMDAPVTFKDTGIDQLIERHVNDAIPAYPVRWDSREFLLGSHFTMPTWGASAYHLSSINLGQFTLAAALRVDYEHAALRYRSTTHTGYTIWNKNANEPFAHESIDIDDGGSLKKDFLQLMPRFTATCHLDENHTRSIYLSVARGSKAGGFNTQMFSDVLQQRLMGMMGIGARYDVEQVVAYKPEWAWNYEAGCHLQAWGNRLTIDAGLFFMDCRDRQLTVFPDGMTTGRMMTNAGRSHSCGMEMAINVNPMAGMHLSASYGYTHATFRSYHDGKADYRGKAVPYAPAHTLWAEASHDIELADSDWARRITIAANVNGAGRIYWNEANDLYQPFYALLGASVTLAGKHYSLQLWGRNLTGTAYHTFHFVSIGHAFLQRGHGRSLGMTLRVNIQ